MKKLKLNKELITQLTDKEAANVQGGRVTTSFGSCTGTLCCSEQPKITELETTCLSDNELPTRPDCGCGGY